MTLLEFRRVEMYNPSSRINTLKKEFLATNNTIYHWEISTYHLVHLFSPFGGIYPTYPTMVLNHVHE